MGGGVARNVSVSGIYFETDAALQDGAALTLTLRFDDSPGGPLRLQCEACIARVGQRNSKPGVGAAITSFKLERIETSAS